MRVCALREQAGQPRPRLDQGSKQRYRMRMRISIGPGHANIHLDTTHAPALETAVKFALGWRNIAKIIQSVPQNTPGHIRKNAGLGPRAQPERSLRRQVKGFQGTPMDPLRVPIIFCARFARAKRAPLWYIYLICSIGQGGWARNLPESKVPHSFPAPHFAPALHVRKVTPPQGPPTVPPGSCGAPTVYA